MSEWRVLPVSWYDGKRCWKLVGCDSLRLNTKLLIRGAFGVGGEYVGALPATPMLVEPWWLSAVRRWRWLCSAGQSRFPSDRTYWEEECVFVFTQTRQPTHRCGTVPELHRVPKGCCGINIAEMGGKGRGCLGTTNINIFLVLRFRFVVMVFHIIFISKCNVIKNRLPTSFDIIPEVGTKF